jgi:type II secretory pathway pseudopilin PulG
MEEGHELQGRARWGYHGDTSNELLTQWKNNPTTEYKVSFVKWMGTLYSSVRKLLKKSGDKRTVANYSPTVYKITQYFSQGQARQKSQCTTIYNEKSKTLGI